MNIIRFFSLLLVCVTIASTGYAGTTKLRIERLKEQIARQKKQLEILSVQVNSLQHPLDVELPDSVQSQSFSSEEQWYNRIAFGGFLLMRHEYQDDKTIAGHKPRNRQLFKLVLNMQAQINDNINVIFQLLSASPTPASSLLIYDDFFDSKDIHLDLAYADWFAGELFGLDKSDIRIWGGKMPNPFYRPQHNQLVWDNDVHPEGGAVRIEHQFSGLYLFANLGGFWINEEAKGADSALWGAQAGMRAKLFNDSVTVTSGIAYFDFSNTAGKETFFFSSNSMGNSYKTVGDKTYYLHDYDLIDTFNEISFRLADMPVSVVFHSVINTAVDDDNLGWSISANIGSTKKTGDWKLHYEYRRLEKDATLGIFTDSNFNNAGTDGKGSILALFYKLAKNTKLATWLYLNKKNLDHPKDVTRAYFDLLVSF